MDNGWKVKLFSGIIYLLYKYRKFYSRYMYIVDSRYMSRKAAHWKAWYSSPILELWQNLQDLSCLGMFKCRPNSMWSR